MLIRKTSVPLNKRPDKIVGAFSFGFHFFLKAIGMEGNEGEALLKVTLNKICQQFHPVIQIADHKWYIILQFFNRTLVHPFQKFQLYNLLINLINEFFCCPADVFLIAVIKHMIRFYVAGF